VHVESSWIPKSCRLFHSRSRSAHETNSLSTVIAVDNTPANRPYSVPPNASKVVGSVEVSPAPVFSDVCIGARGGTFHFRRLVHNLEDYVWIRSVCTISRSCEECIRTSPISPNLTSQTT
jgi:hypothetical protein